MSYLVFLLIVGGLSYIAWELGWAFFEILAVAFGITTIILMVGRLMDMIQHGA